MPTRSIIVTAKSIESGMAEATISPARRLPRKANRTAMTSDRPLEQVPLDGVEHLVDQVGPLVDDRRRRRRAAGSSSRPAWPCPGPGSRRGEFSPIRMKARPRTTSPLPLAVTPPRRIAWPMPTSATSRTRIGTPSLAVMTILPISSTRAGPADPLDQARLAGPRRRSRRRRSGCSLRRARITSSSVRSYLASLTGRPAPRTASRARPRS